MSKKQIVDELHKPTRRHFKRRTVVLKGINDLWQADLVEMGDYSKENKGYRYLLTVIDAFSKFAWAVPIKNKTAHNVTAAMRSILLQKHPKNLQTDNGKEFYNTEFQQLMLQYGINHYSTYSTKKASIVERFNRTLKEWMWKKFSLNGSYKWLNLINDLVKMYNSKFHRTIKMKPCDVGKTEEKHLLNTVYNKIKTMPKPKFKVGDRVRISKFKHIFEKGYTPNWTTEIFSIYQIKNTNPVTYILKDFEDKIISGSFYEAELAKTKYPNLYLVERVLKRKGSKIYVKWLGFSKSYNSWIDKKDALL